MPRIISWNTQGSYGSKLSECYSELLTGADNIIMIQEAGNVGHKSGECFDVIYGTRIYSHKFKACFFEQPDADNIRCTTGMLVETTIAEDPIIKSFYLEGKRPVVCFECRLKNNKTGEFENFVFATVHLTSNEVAAKKELAKIYTDFECKYNNSHWFIMGDFNCDVRKIKDINNNQISSPPRQTHRSGSILDYALHSKSLSGIIKVINGVPNNEHMIPLSSDHYPISCSFDF